MNRHLTDNDQPELSQAASSGRLTLPAVEPEPLCDLNPEENEPDMRGLDYLGSFLAHSLTKSDCRDGSFQFINGHSEESITDYIDSIMNDNSIAAWSIQFTNAVCNVHWYRKGPPLSWADANHMPSRTRRAWSIDNHGGLLTLRSH